MGMVVEKTSAPYISRKHRPVHLVDPEMWVDHRSANTRAGQSRIGMGDNQINRLLDFEDSLCPIILRLHRNYETVAGDQCGPATQTGFGGQSMIGAPVLAAPNFLDKLPKSVLNSPSWPRVAGVD